jgi:hypothetical protein
LDLLDRRPPACVDSKGTLVIFFFAFTGGAFAAAEELFILDSVIVLYPGGISSYSCIAAVAVGRSPTADAILFAAFPMLLNILLILKNPYILFWTYASNTYILNAYALSAAFSFAPLFALKQEQP